jgi:two-component system OmpR family sensor kinase
MKMLKSIRLQLTLWYIGSISLLILIFGVIAFFSLQRILVKNIDNTLYNGGKSLELSLSEYALKRAHDPKSLYEVDEDEETFFVDEIDEEVDELFFVNVAYIQLLTFPEAEDIAPQEIAKTTTLQERSLPISHNAYHAVKNGTNLSETVTGIFSFPLRVMSLQVFDRDGRPYILQLALSLQDVQTTLRNLLLIFVVLFPPLLVIVSALGYVFMKRAFLPVKKMVAVTKSITAEDLSLRLDPLDSRDEIGELAETLNEMISRLERSFKQIRQFSGDVSHELKTPLAELKCNAEVALRKERTPEEYQTALQNVIEDAESLQKIVEDLLFLARMDSQSIPLLLTSLALHDVFFEAFEGMHVFAKQKKLAIEFQEIEHVYIKGDPGLLKRLLTNLIVNAIQYTPSGGEITFSLHQKTNHAVLTITDTGIGIPEEALPYIFDRFYRVEQSRSHETGGSGLGLAIVQKIVEVHGGHISVQSAVGKGTTFRVSLPCLA